MSQNTTRKLRLDLTPAAAAEIDRMCAELNIDQQTLLCASLSIMRKLLETPVSTVTQLDFSGLLYAVRRLV